MSYPRKTLVLRLSDCVETLENKKFQPMNAYTLVELWVDSFVGPQEH